MKTSGRLLIGLLLVGVVALDGCVSSRPTGPKVPPTKQPPAVTAPDVAIAASRTIAQTGTPIELTGSVTLISDKGAAIISDNGGGVISNNSGNVLSNNGGNIISDNGGGLIANNGGSLVGKTKYGVLQAGKPQQYALADAVVTVRDAQGRTLVDAAGKPIMATSDKTGAYRFSAVLPDENLVLHIAINNKGALSGGQLSAMIPKQASKQRQQTIDTASSLGAAYVLGQYVKGSQATYDKLPASEALRLRDALEAARKTQTTAPSYEPDDLVALTETLRKDVPAVGQVLADIKALLLGQAEIGAGRKATEVALQGLRGIVLDDKGGMFLAEEDWGRIRYVTADGTITTYADKTFGQVKTSFIGIKGIAWAPDGSIYVATRGLLRRIAPDGIVSNVTRNGLNTHGPRNLPAAESDVVPGKIVVGPDGTLFVCESATGKEDTEDTSPPRVVSIGKDGIVRAVPVDPSWGPGAVIGVIPRADGTFLILHFAKSGAAIHRSKADGTWEKVATGFNTMVSWGTPVGFVQAKDGTIYISEDGAKRVTAIAPDGTRRVVAGAGATGPASELGTPGEMALRADGTLLVTDRGAGLVRALGTDGSWTVIAGTTATVQSGDGSAIAINSPTGIVLDAQQRIILAESGSHTIKRYDGKTFETIVGTTEGYAGDGGPATEARFAQPSALAMRDNELYVMDAGNWRLRKVDVNGIVSTLTGGKPDGDIVLTAGVPVGSERVQVRSSLGLAFGGDGRLYWTEPRANQIQRLSLDGTTVELVAGKPSAILGFDPVTEGPAIEAILNMPTNMVADKDGNLYFSDTGNLCIRRIVGLKEGQPRIETVAGASIAELLTRVGQEPKGEEGVDAKTAWLVAPGGLCFDAAGNLYVGELGTVNLERFTVNLNAVFSPADLGFPEIYARVRKITPEGKITTIAGPGGRVFTDPQAADALVLPTGLCIDGQGRLVIVDSGSNQLRFLPAGSY